MPGVKSGRWSRAARAWRRPITPVPARGRRQEVREDRAERTAENTEPEEQENEHRLFLEQVLQGADGGAKLLHRARVVGDHSRHLRVRALQIFVMSVLDLVQALGHAIVPGGVACDIAQGGMAQMLVEAGVAVCTGAAIS